MREIILDDEALKNRPGFADFYSLWTDFFTEDPTGADKVTSGEILRAIETTEDELVDGYYQGEKSMVYETSYLALKAVLQSHAMAAEMSPGAAE